MVNYQLGKIYKIVCNETGEQYIGATCQQKLCTRLAQHVSKKNDCSSKAIIDRGNYDMLLIESYPCSSRDELHQRERFHIESVVCINKNIPGKTHKEYRNKYYDENKSDILNKHKKYYDENKVDILKQQKDYYVDNREKK